MKKTIVTLVPLQPDDREQFIVDNQLAFKYGAMEEFGERDNHFEEEGEIISRKTIEKSIDADNSEAYRIIVDDKKVGGLVLKIDTTANQNELELLFVSPENHSRGIGYGAWLEVEKLHPETIVWKTCTPYFETRNIHFYINKCGFHAVAFWNKFLPDPYPCDEDDTDNYNEDDGFDGMFYFEKYMK